MKRAALALVIAAGLLAPAANAATIYPNSIGANWGGCTGNVTMRTPYWGNVSGASRISCAKAARYELRLTTGWRGFNDIWTTSAPVVSGPFTNRDVTTDNSPMPLSISGAFWGCIQVNANVYGGSGLYTIANACSYYVK